MVYICIAQVLGLPHCPPAMVMMPSEKTQRFRLGFQTLCFQLQGSAMQTLTILQGGHAIIQTCEVPQLATFDSMRVTLSGALLLVATALAKSYKHLVG